MRRCATSEKVPASDRAIKNEASAMTANSPAPNGALKTITGRRAKPKMPWKSNKPVMPFDRGTRGLLFLHHSPADCAPDAIPSRNVPSVREKMMDLVPDAKDAR